MFSHQIYHVIHLVGLVCVFIGFGALLSQNFKTAMRWHGIGLLISLITGFGMVAKMKLPYTSGWLITKMALWLVLGFLPVLAKRRVLAAPAVVALAAVVGATLAYLGYMKPF